MLHDFSTWDVDYNSIVNRIRTAIVGLATDLPGYTSTLMQGSGTFAVEATIGSVVPANGKLLIASNGAYGKRMAQIASRLQIDHTEIVHRETEPVKLSLIEAALQEDSAITHMAMVHCETTTGMLNSVEETGQLAARHGKSFIVDAMSSFGGIPLSMEGIHADFVISSANKCIQGVPGFGFVVASEADMQEIAGRARSLSLDLHDQWQEMQANNGKWRFTSPTHVVCAFAQALDELAKEGGVNARHSRYRENHKRLVDGMREIGFRTLLPDELQSPIITSFLFPEDARFEFGDFYNRMKARRFVLYPGKISNADSFRIGTIGHVFPDDISQLIRAVAEVVQDMSISM